ncbi:MAG: class I SAM-dependent methyltransferase [Treponema sp.]|nr:class I SAM-dependent methyltransferase [Treponema sp.]
MRTCRRISDGLHLQIGDCCDLPFEDNFFAAATSINTVYFWKDTVKGLSEIRRVLKPGGAFFNVVYTKESLDKLAYTRTGFKKFELEQLLEAGKAAGFDDIHVKDIVEGESFAVVCRK